MKTNIILFFISVLSFGGLLMTPGQPSSEAQPVKIAPSSDYVKNPNIALQKSLDSINSVRLQKIQYYETEITNTFKVIEEEQKRLQKINVSTDSLLSVLITIDTLKSEDTLIVTTKKPGWLKKQLNKLKNK